MNFWDRSGVEESTVEDLALLSSSVIQWGVASFKYIDDTAVLELVPLADSIKHFTTGLRLIGLETGTSGWPPVLRTLA